MLDGLRDFREDGIKPEVGDAGQVTVGVTGAHGNADILDFVEIQSFHALPDDHLFISGGDFAEIFLRLRQKITTAFPIVQANCFVRAAPFENAVFLVLIKIRPCAVQDFLNVILHDVCVEIKVDDSGVNRLIDKGQNLFVRTDDERVVILINELQKLPTFFHGSKRWISADIEIIKIDGQVLFHKKTNTPVLMMLVRKSQATIQRILPEGGS